MHQPGGFLTQSVGERALRSPCKDGVTVDVFVFFLVDKTTRIPENGVVKDKNIAAGFGGGIF